MDELELEGTVLAARVDPCHQLHWVAGVVRMSHGPWAVEGYNSLWGSASIFEQRSAQFNDGQRLMTAYGAEQECREVCERLNIEHARWLMLKPEGNWECQRCGKYISPDSVVSIHSRKVYCEGCVP